VQLHLSPTQLGGAADANRAAVILKAQLHHE